MAIRFVPNDPLAQGGPPDRQKPPRPNPKHAGFKITDNPPQPSEDVYEKDDWQFLYWQCREAVLAALDTWESLAEPISQWAEGYKEADLATWGNTGLDAHYYRREPHTDEDGKVISQGSPPRLWFDVLIDEKHQYIEGKRITFVGASTDVVAHETGHAILDAVRPDLWNLLGEPAAFHEGFGDCVALLTALAADDIRTSVLEHVGQSNFVEALGEDLADSIKRRLPKLSSKVREQYQHFSEPRHLLNDFKWTQPSALNPTGKPGTLLNEPHSFSQILSGAFYDTIRKVFAQQPKQDEAGLHTAMVTAGKLLFAAVPKAAPTTRQFEEVGGEMLLADKRLFNGANQGAVRDAFNAHNLDVDRAAQQLKSAPPDTRLQQVPLDDLHDELRGVVAEGPVTGKQNGDRKEQAKVHDHVKEHVEMLLHRGHVQLGSKSAHPVSSLLEPLPTHAVRTHKGKRVLKRIRFSCR